MQILHVHQLNTKKRKLKTKKNKNHGNLFPVGEFGLHIYLNNVQVSQTSCQFEETH